MLASLYEEGKGVPQDCAAAADLLRTFITERGSWSRRMGSALRAHDQGRPRRCAWLLCSRGPSPEAVGPGYTAS